MQEIIRAELRNLLTQLDERINLLEKGIRTITKNQETILLNQGYLEENQLEIFKALSELSKGRVLCIGEDK